MNEVDIQIVLQLRILVEADLLFPEVQKISSIVILGVKITVYRLECISD